MDALIQDLRYAARGLRKAPGFTLAAVLTFALGIGAMTGIFSLVNVVLLQPPPYPSPDRVFVLASPESASQDGQTFHYVRARCVSFSRLAAMSGSSGWNLVVGDRAEYVTGMPVTAAFFDVLGVLPRLGRGFSDAEDAPNGPRAVILSDSTWRRLVGGGPDAVGRVVELGGVAHTVVGVMPPSFRTFPAADLWTPLRLSANDTTSNYVMLGRLRDGASPAAAASELGGLKAEMRTALRGAARFRTQTADWVTYQRWRGREGRDALLILLSAVAFLLLIACANVASLQLVRAVARQHEMATRSALGANRRRLIRQLAAESTLLAVVGAIVGIGLAKAVIGGFVTVVPAGLLDGRTVDIDARVLTVTIAITLIVGVLFGLAPTIGLARLDVRAALGDGTRNTGGRQTTMLRRAFTVVEVVFAVVLLVGAGLLIRTFVNLRAQPLGFDPSDTVVGKMSLQGSTEQTSSALAVFFDRTLTRIREQPGVVAAAVSNNIPVERGLNLDLAAPDGSVVRRPSAVDWRYVTSEYFLAFRIPLRAGRMFDTRDQAQGSAVAIVNDAFARVYFRGASVLGRTLRIGESLGDAPRQIVGVVADVKGLSGAGWTVGTTALGAQTTPIVYVPVAQVPARMLQLVHRFTPTNWIVRTGPHAEVILAVQNILRTAEPRLPFMRFETMEQVIAHDLQTERFLMTLLTVFSTVALSLAAVGIYVLTAYSVAQRTREVGIRMAIGATRGRVVLSFFAEGLRLVLIGEAIGGLAAALASGTLKSIVFGIRPLDPITFVGGGVLLIVVSGLGALIPALRAARVDPISALRTD